MATLKKKMNKYPAWLPPNIYAYKDGPTTKNSTTVT